MEAKNTDRVTSAGVRFCYDNGNPRNLFPCVVQSHAFELSLRETTSLPHHIQVSLPSTFENVYIFLSLLKLNTPFDLLLV